MKKLFTILFILFFIPAIAFADAQLEGVPVIDQDIFEDTLNVRYICGPTSFAELVGFWDSHGYPDLVDGELSGNVPDTSSTMVDFFIDAMEYSSYDGNYTYPEGLANGIEDYFIEKGYEVNVTYYTYGQPRWHHIQTELDAGRPVILGVRSWNHWVVVTGYKDNPVEMQVLYGHIPYERSYYATRYPYIPYSRDAMMITVEPLGSQPPPPPPPNPENEPWYEDVIEWCEENGWELEVAD